MYIQASSYKAGAGKTSILDVSENDGSLGSSNPDVDITTTANGDVIVAVLGDGYNNVPTAQSGTNLNRTDNGTFSDSNQYYLQATAGLYNVNWTCGNDDWVLYAVAFKEISGSLSASPSASPSGSPSASISASPSASLSGSPSGSPSVSESGSPSVSASASLSASPSASESASPSGSPSSSLSGSPSASASASKSASPSASLSSSPSVSLSPSSSSSGSPSASPSGSKSSSPSGSPSVSASASPSPEYTSVDTIRLIPFIYSATIAYMCEFGDRYIRFFYNGAPLLTGGGTHVEVTTPYDESDLYELQYKQVGDVMWITHNEYKPYKLTRTSATVFSLDEIVFEKGPFLTRNDVENNEDTDSLYNATMTCDVTAKGDTGVLTASEAFFESSHVGALFKLTHPRVNLKTEGTMAPNTTGLIGEAIDIFGDYTFEITSSTWAGTVRLQRTYNDWATSSNIETFTNAGTEIYTGNEYTANAQYRINVTAHTTGTIKASLVTNTSSVKGEKTGSNTGIIGNPLPIKGDFVFAFHDKLTGTIILERNENDAGWETFRTYTSDDGDGNVRYTGTETEDNVKYRINVTEHTKGTVTADLTASESTKSGIVRIDSITSTTVAAITVVSDIASATPTKRWAEGAWSEKQGYPSSITFFENRCVYGKANKKWLSESDNYEDFEMGANDDDSFEIPILTTNTVRWLESADDLVIGTSGEELAFGTENVQKPFVTPTNWTIKGKTTYGSKLIQPVKVNDCILFVDFVGRKIRELVFNGDKYVAPDLTALSEDITLTGIINIAFQKNPDPILWCVLTDGSLISMTYDREQNVVAWSEYPMDGWVQSVAVIPSTSEDEIWISIIRSIGTDNKVYIEQFQPRAETAIEDAFFVDSGITYDGVSTTTITGLGHLEGKTVSVLGDGVVLDNEVVSGGQITTSAAVTKAQVGLPFVSQVSPMRMDLNLPTGTTKGSVKKISEIVVSFYKTLGTKYGFDSSNLWDIDFETTSLFTGDRVLVFDAGFDTEDTLLIYHDDPLPCVVRAIILRLDVVGR